MADLDGLEWDAAGFSSNPVPGDPDKTEELANHYKTRSGNFRDMADALDRIKNNSANLQGKWVQKLDKDFGNMPADFRDFSDSCSTVGGRIGAWASDMRSFQNVARLEYERAKEARDQSARLQCRSDEQQSRYVSCGRELRGLSDDCSSRRAEVERQRDAAKDLLDRYGHALAGTTADYDRAHGAIDRVKSEYDAAAARHAVAIKAIDCVPKSIIGVERFYYSDGWRKIVMAVKVVSFAAAIASFFVGGWLVLAVGAAAAAAQLAITFVQRMENDASWVDIAFASASAVLALLPFLTLSKKLSGLLGKTFDEVSSPKVAFRKSPLEAVQKNMNEMLYGCSGNGAGIPKHAVSVESLNGWKDTLKWSVDNKKFHLVFGQFTVSGKAWATGSRFGKYKEFVRYDWVENVGKAVMHTKPAVKYVENGINNPNSVNWQSTGDMAAQYLLPGYDKVVKSVESIGKVAEDAW